MTLTDLSPARPALPRTPAIGWQAAPSLIVTLAIGVMLGLFMANASDYAARLQAEAPGSATLPAPDWHGNVRSSATPQ
ncbi:hypothetical protein [Vannielia litorea]|uniref:hypothetical protein n=1 Tax=Vannielia litorea TaxID=1217970 RepID=UPI001BCC3F71|nr:hypothetical protein [Vannielia litorea]MBS8226108.1 hypothetical protein [Vannielia litorea]